MVCRGQAVSYTHLDVYKRQSCIYPKLAPQPIPEASLLTGPLEPTNEWYAVAKIAGLKTCQALRRQYGWDAISAMPTNLYGPGDNFNLENAHVLPALIRKFHEARRANEAAVVIWGTGAPRREFLFVEDCADALLFPVSYTRDDVYKRQAPRREFLFVEDCADALLFLLESYSDEQIINVGVGSDLTIEELAHLVRDIVGFKGSLVFDTSKPDGTPRKLLDVSRLTRLGWRARTPLAEGIRATYDWYVSNMDTARR